MHHPETVPHVRRTNAAGREAHSASDTTRLESPLRMRPVGFAGASEVDWRQMFRRRLHLAATAIVVTLVCIAGLPFCPANAGRHDVSPASWISTQDAEPEAEEILETIEKAIQSGDVRSLSGHFSSRVYLNLPTGEKGYYSSEQSFFIMKRFFQSYAPVSFTFSSSSPDGDSPYGMGTLSYVKVGQRGKMQVFVSLRHVNRQWKISQITVAQR